MHQLVDEHEIKWEILQFLVPLVPLALPNLLND